MEMIIAQVVGIIATVIVLFVVFSKDIKKILIGEMTANLVLAVNYLCLDGLSGAGISIIATLQTFVFYLFQRKDKKVPVWLIILFLVIYGAWCVYTYKSPADIIPGICVLFFALAIMQKNPAKYRFLKVFNGAGWVIYDISVLAFTTIITHAIVLITSIIAIIKVDLKKKK